MLIKVILAAWNINPQLTKLNPCWACATRLYFKDRFTVRLYLVFSHLSIKLWTFITSTSGIHIYITYLGALKLMLYWYIGKCMVSMLKNQ